MVSISILLASTEWIFTYIMEIVAKTLPMKVFWNQVQYIGGSVMVTSLFVLALQSTGQDKWLSRRNILLINIIPIFTLLLIFTNGFHGLIWPYHVLVARRGVLWLEHPHGPLYWVYIVYIELLMLSVILFLIWSVMRSSSRPYRRQALMILSGLLIPFIVSLLGPLGFNWLYPLNLNQMAFVLAFIPISWGLLRLQVGDIVPVARAAVFDGMTDCVLVLNVHDQIVDINAAAQALFQCKAKEVIGKPVEMIWKNGRFIDTFGRPVKPFWLKPSGRLVQPDENTILSQEIVLKQGEENRYFDMRIFPLVDWRSYVMSQVIVLRNITGRIRAKQMLQKAKTELEARIRERTAELSAANAQLQHELTIRRRAEKSLQKAHDELETRVAERMAELSIMLEIAQTVSATLGLDKTLLIIAQKMTEAIGVSGCTISRYEREADAVITWIEWRADGAEFAEERGTTYALVDFPATRTVIDERRPVMVLVSDPDADPAKVAHMRQVDSASLLMLPLVMGNETIGLVELDESKRERVFTSAEIQLCQALADQAAIAIQNARLYDASRHRLDELTRLLRAGITITSSLDRQEILDTLLYEVIPLLGATSAYVCRWDIDKQTTTVIAECFGPDALPAERVSDLGVTYEGEWLPAELLEPDQTYTLRRSDPDMESGWREHFEQYACQSILLLPLTASRENLAYIEVWESRRERIFSENEQLLGLNLVSQAAVALENARLYAETRRRLQEQVFLREAGILISSELDLGTVLRRIIQQMGQAVDATSAYICNYGEDQLTAEVIAEYMGPEADPREQISDLGVTYQEDDMEFRAIMLSGQHEVADIDDPNLLEADRMHMKQFGAKTILYIPLRIKDELVGYAELWESRRRRVFTPDEIALCHDMAQQAAIAFENARLYEQAQQEIGERKLAEARIQASLSEKEVLLKEIHHRVKNNLQVISSLLSLQSDAIADEVSRDVLRESRHRVRSMALIHEKLYRSTNLARIDFGDYVENLAAYLVRSYNAQAQRVSLQVEVEAVYLDVDTAVPCGLILNELVSNALKHGFGDGRNGRITIRLQAKGDHHYCLTVADNGVGFPSHLDYRRSKTLGLQLVNTLVNQLEGMLTINTTQGTSVALAFEDRKAKELP